jgi:hypothetical protein
VRLAQLTIVDCVVNVTRRDSVFRFEMLHLKPQLVVSGLRLAHVISLSQ